MPARRLLPPLLALLLAGCGNARTPPPAVTVAGPPVGLNPQRVGGLRFDAPAGWNYVPGTAPTVATISTGEASIAIFRYPRPGLPLPQTASALDTAADALANAARQRDPTFAEQKRGRLRVSGKPAIVLRGTETIEGQKRVVRSTHVYAYGDEIIVDAFAPPADFKRVDAQFFRALVRSLRITRPPG